MEPSVLHFLREIHEGSGMLFAPAAVCNCSKDESNFRSLRMLNSTVRAARNVVAVDRTTNVCHLLNRFILLCLFAALGAWSSSAQVQVSVLTQHNDNGRTGQNLNETILNTTNVNKTQFGKLFALPVLGQIYAQPLYVPNVQINGGTHNVLIVATEQDLVYAFDADTLAAPLWSVSMLNVAHGVTDDETFLTSATTIGCTDLQPDIGISATPVIDSVGQTIYVEAKSTNGSAYFHRLHALSLLTGAEKAPGPVVITATVSGTGDGSNKGS